MSSQRTPVKHPHTDEEDDEEFQSPPKIMKSDEDLVNKMEEAAIDFPDSVKEGAAIVLPESVKETKVLEKSTEEKATCSRIEEKSVYARFTSFSQLELDIPLNVGTFGVITCVHVPYGENVNLTVPVTNLVFIDREKNKACFTIFGENAEAWKDLQPGQVVHCENFKWQKDYKKSSQYYGITSDFIGSLSSDTIFEVHSQLSERFAAHRAKDIQHVTKLLDIHQPFDRVVFTLDSKGSNQKKVRKSDNALFTLRSCMFSTADGGLVEITAFEKNCEIFDALDIHKSYAIEHLKKCDPVRNSRVVNFHVTSHTTFLAVDFQPDPVVKVALKDLTSAKITDPVIFESELFLCQESGKAKRGMKQCVGFQLDQEKETHLKAVIVFADSIDLHRGQKIRFKYRVGENWGKKVLNVIGGSMEILPESYPVDNIDVLPLKFI